jgi:Family of unknown function (DUF6519)
MKADLTRDTFRSFKHFRRVLMQQGRVQLDADWNEQAAILLHYLQSLAFDVIGQAGGTAGAFAISALSSTPPVTSDFRIALGDYYVDGILCEAESNPVYIFQPTTTGKSATVGADRLTLDGAEFQNTQYVELFDDAPPPLTAAFPPTLVQISNVDPVKRQLTLTGPFDQAIQGSATILGTALGQASNPALRRVITYLTQPDYPVPDPLTVPNSYLVYLDVWERHITYIEDDCIREVALGGPDTATRAKVVWQVKVTPGQAGTTAPGRGGNVGNKPCDNFIPTDPNLLTLLFGTRRGRLKAMAQQKSTATDPCIIPPDANYRGAENQLYRVEIHRPGPAWDGTDNAESTAATFKWSRENGSVVFPVVSVTTGSGTTTVVLENLGRDDRFGLSEGDWVELLDDAYELQNSTAPLLQVQAIDSGSLKVTLSGAADSKIGSNPARHPLLRRWDQKEGDPAEGGLTLGSDNAALIQESSDGNWLVLEDGVQIQFQPPVPGRQPNQYRTGDYWLIPARTATGDVEWPRETIKDSTGTNLIVPIAKPPDGIQHHYAPLAVVNVSAAGIQVMTPDCRKTIQPSAS